ncbi:MAG: transcriptional repressor [Chloroflexi bacterium]|nr:transcriptional repressor [Chloroflexota bacterium]
MEKQHQDLDKVLRQKGFRVTPSRQVIWDTLSQYGGHISADNLADLVHQTAPKIGRMTVYRTLELLSQLGLVRPIYQGSGAAHYILMNDGHHHHLICSDCQQVIEFDECVVGEIANTISSRFGFEISGHLLEFYGHCADCQINDGSKIE